MKVQKIEFDGYRIGIPVPFPMKYVYCYLFKQNEGYVLIDTGLNDQAARNAWQEVFSRLNIAPKDIHTIYLTHFHPDHSGLAGWMQQLTGAKLSMHKNDAEMMERIWGEGSTQTIRMKEMVLDHGVPEQLSKEIIEHMKKLEKHVYPQPNVHVIPKEVTFAQKQWQVIHTPGHSNGHICFYEKGEEILLSGDHILDQITPNISVWPGASQNPLHEYMHSLQKMKKIAIKKVYSAHGTPITKVAERIDQLVCHHVDRLSFIEKLVQNKTAYEIAKILFAQKELTPHQWRFAIAETIAHLNYLKSENRIKQEGSRPIIYKKEVKIA